jgi:hypothetical protein
LGGRYGGLEVSAWQFGLRRYSYIAGSSGFKKRIETFFVNRWALKRILRSANSDAIAAVLNAYWGFNYLHINENCLL